mgnify:CR=1 FL=1
MLDPLFSDAEIQRRLTCAFAHEGRGRATLDAWDAWIADADMRGIHGRIFGPPRLQGPTGAPPDAPPASNITPGGEISAWSDTEFIKTIRTGVNPAGKQLDAFTPYKYLGRLSDDELKAIYLYLKTVPVAAMGAR